MQIEIRLVAFDNAFQQKYQSENVNTVSHRESFRTGSPNLIALFSTGLNTSILVNKSIAPKNSKNFSRNLVTFFASKITT